MSTDCRTVSFSELPNGTVLRLTTTRDNVIRVKLVGERIDNGWGCGPGRDVEVLACTHPINDANGVTMHVATLEGFKPEATSSLGYACTAIDEITAGHFVVLDVHRDDGAVAFEIASFEVETSSAG